MLGGGGVRGNAGSGKGREQGICGGEVKERQQSW
jgi:hypothetical protein